VKLFFDANVWIEHLRADALAPILPRLRGKYQLWMEAVVAAELIAGCRSREERRVVQGLVSQFAKVGRMRAASAPEIIDAGRVLSSLRERGMSPSNAAGALIDSVIAVSATRAGALLVTENVRDFEKLAQVLPLRWETLTEFSARL
jgi:predicted nucleic acid-binding protein